MKRSAPPWASLHCDGPDCALSLGQTEPDEWMELTLDDQRTRHFCSMRCAVAFVEAYEIARASFGDDDITRGRSTSEYIAYPPTTEPARDR